MTVVVTVFPAEDALQDKADPAGVVHVTGVVGKVLFEVTVFVMLTCCPLLWTIPLPVTEFTANVVTCVPIEKLAVFV
ncbi:MAG TPA: hypothetical protein VFA16_13780 [Mycobacterium sp.]|uniref:hypothetical protein n=1 Tax=Mycobacterium sp. TaxID=1785 RepID=UPI002D6E8869|nr:hypothetical protein [Mycobacterium sp.]HZU48303.1 hypothetical protein [Mycobacterium sp.]